MRQGVERSVAQRRGEGHATVMDVGGDLEGGAGAGERGADPTASGRDGRVERLSYDQFGSLVEISPPACAAHASQKDISVAVNQELARSVPRVRESADLAPVVARREGARERGNAIVTVGGARGAIAALGAAREEHEDCGDGDGGPEGDVGGAAHLPVSRQAARNAIGDGEAVMRDVLAKTQERDLLRLLEGPKRAASEVLDRLFTPAQREAVLLALLLLGFPSLAIPPEERQFLDLLVMELTKP